jgi:stage IV sporulation protein B
VRGKAGELRGMFISDKQLGNADKLCSCGIFGKINEGFNLENLTQLVASSSAAMPGEAYIYSTVDGVCVERFEIEIVKVDKANKENKNYVIKITDENLIEKTGGIVQGMSGSPIIQQGKLIGAVTHVFLNDPTRGYGIDVETMLKE